MGPFGCLMKLNENGPTKSKSSCHEVSSEFLATNTPDLSRWTLNRCFGAFRTIWVHFGPFGCVMKLSAKRADLVQKFVPRSCVGIFHNERTRSTPMDPKLMFCSVLYYLGAFGTVWLPSDAKRAELVQKFVPRSRVIIFRNEHT